MALQGEAGEDTLEPVEAEPEVDRAKIATDAGFPNVEIYDLYGGDIERYRQEEAEYAGFPDWDTYTQYAGDSTAYQNDLAVAEGWPDAATKEEYGTLERYAQHLKDQADLDAQGQAWEQQQKDAQDALNEELAQSNGFPDYATYLEFDGDVDAYLDSLPPPVVGGVWGDEEDVTDTLIGGAGNDTFKASEGDVDDIGFDTSVGLDGEDTFVGNDTLISGDGNDTFKASEGDVDDIGFDTSIGLDGEDTFVGDDTLVGGDGNDTFKAAEGEDELDDIGFDTSTGLDGKDTLGDLDTLDGGDDTLDTGDDTDLDLDEELDEDTLRKLLQDGADSDSRPGGDLNDLLPGLGDEDLDDDTLRKIIEGDTPLVVVAKPENDPFGGDTPPIVVNNPANDPFGGDTPVVTDPANDPLGGDMPEKEEEEIDPATGLPRVKVQPPPKTVTPPKKPITPIPPGLTPEQLMQFFGQLGAPGIMGALQPYEMPYYFQIPEEQQFDITEAFSPTLYRLQKE